MFSVYVWVRVVGVVVCLFVALVMWRRGQRLHSLALGWYSLAFVAWALNAGFDAVGQLAAPLLYLWAGLQFAAFILGVCASVVAMVYLRKDTQRGSGMQRERSS